MKMLAFLLMVLFLPAAAAAQSEKERSKIEADILAVMDAQVVAWNRGDIDTFMNGYWKSDKLVFASGNDITRGWQTTLDRYKKNYSSRDKIGTLSFGNIEINIV